MQDENIDLKAWITLFVLSLIWGSSFILIKKSLVSFDPIQLACMRISISAIALSPFLFIHRDIIEWNRWPLFLLVGTMGNGIPAFLFFFAQTEISSTLSGLLNSLTPIWTLLIGVVFFSIPFKIGKLWGVLLGFLGAAMLILVGNTVGMQGNIWYGLLVVVATFCYGLSGNLVKHFFQNTKSIIISAGSFAAISMPAILYLAFFCNFSTMDLSQTETVTSLGAILILSIVGTVISTVVFYRLIKNTSAVFGSSVAYIMPMVALFWGFLDGEPLMLYQIIGMVLILVGVYMIRRS